MGGGGEGTRRFQHRSRSGVVGKGKKRGPQSLRQCYETSGTGKCVYERHVMQEWCKCAVF